MNKLPEPREHDVQDAIVQWLQLHQYYVLVTTAYKQRGSSGVQKGIPDLLVGHKRFGPGVLIGLEVKRPGKHEFSSKEQRLNWLRGLTIVVQSKEAALEALESVKSVRMERKPASGAIYACEIYDDENLLKEIANQICKIELKKAKKRQARRGLR